jgi:hypothetical protein
MLSAFAEGVWFDTGPVNFLGMRLTATMTALRVGDAGLLLHSPLPMTLERRAAVESLGAVRHLYAPNTFHHQWLGEWSRAFPTAVVHAPAELASKTKGLRIDRFHDQAPACDFGAHVVEVPIRGFRLAETALVYRPGSVAVVTDLVHNIGRPAHGWTKTYSSLMGFYDRVAMSRVLRWTAFNDKNAARQSVDALLDHGFEGLIVGHGAPIPAVGREALAAAVSWLPTARALLPAVKTTRAPWFSPKPCG